MMIKTTKNRLKSLAKEILHWNTTKVKLQSSKNFSDPFKYCIDSPTPNEAMIATPFIIISGWIVADPEHQITSLTLRNDDTYSQPLTLVSRPDVEAAYPTHAILGFQECLSITDLTAGNRWFIEFLLDDRPHQFTVKFSIDRELADRFSHQKTEKLQKITSILRCPLCKSDRLEASTRLLHCSNCHSQFEWNPKNYNFLNQILTDYANIKPTSMISANNYDPIAIDIIEKFKDGLILDNGCGLRHVYYDNIVNLDIVNYPTTDVVSIGGKLPFKSGVFDAIFSLVVLEHVKNPFECAKEIVRVLKPGGTLYVVVPFLQPFHGYPDHYYNMTSSGLKNLFPDLNIVECNVPAPGLPIAALTWFLNSYINGLPAAAADRFKKMKIGDLLDRPEEYLQSDFVSQLHPKVNEELACCNYIIAKKP